MKNKSIKYAILLLMLFPLVLAVYFSFKMNAEKPTTDTLNKIDITDTHGQTFSYTDKETLDFYLKLTDKAQKMEKLLRSLDEESPIKVKFTEVTSSYTYDFYPTKEPDDCIFRNTVGEYYKIDIEDAGQLLLRDEFSSVFPNDRLPSAQIILNDRPFSLSPISFEWKFMKLDNKFYDSKEVPVNAEATLVKLKKGDACALNFEVAPDLINAKAYVNGEVVFDGDPAQLTASLDYKNDTPITLEISAEWIEEENKGYHGKAVYSAEALFDVPASFRLVDPSLSRGEFTIIEFSNLNDDDDVTFVTDLIAPDLKVQSAGGLKFAFLPISTYNQPGVYPIHITINGEQKTVNFPVKNKLNQSFEDKVQIALANDAIPYDAQKKYDEVIKNLIANSEKELLWNDTADNFKFAEPVPGAKEGGPVFGINVFYPANISSAPVRHTGIDLIAAKGTGVLSTARGKVVFADSLDLPGNTVIIDHGLGVFSYYEHLDTIECKVGDIVEKGVKIGTVGQTGYAATGSSAEPHLHFSVSIGSTFINPKTNYTYGISITKRNW